MQGQYGKAGDKRLSRVVRDVYQEWGFRRGIMRGFWATVAREIPAYAGYVSSLVGLGHTLTPFQLLCGFVIPHLVSKSLMRIRFRICETTVQEEPRSNAPCVGASQRWIVWWGECASTIRL